MGSTDRGASTTLGRRAQHREEVNYQELSDDSVGELASRLVDDTANPLRRLVRAELQQRVRQAVEELPETSREILVLRHLEHLSTEDVAEVLSIGVSAAKMRHLRAVERLRDLLGDAATANDSLRPSPAALDRPAAIRVLPISSSN